VQCPECHRTNPEQVENCNHCGSSLRIASLEVIRGVLPERLHFLKPRSYSIGRSRQNDLILTEPSVSKFHARILYDDDGYSIEDRGSLHGVHINGVRVQRAQLKAGSEIQLGNVTLRFSTLGKEGTTGEMAPLPWIEQQQLLLSIIQTINSSLVLDEVLEHVLEAVIRITRAERGFLLLADESSQAERYETIAGLILRLGRYGDGSPITPGAGAISTSVVTQSIATGETIATGDALADPTWAKAESIIARNLRTIVCIPMLSPPSEIEGGVSELRSTITGALYVDNQRTSDPFSIESLKAAEALARHAALAIENAKLFEREKRTIQELRTTQKQLLQSEKLATIGMMAAGIAHELNTPLTYILGNLELLFMQNPETTQRELLDSISRGTQRLQSLAQSLLAFSRPTLEQRLLVCINDIIERCLEMCRYQLAKKSIRVEKRLASDLPKIHANPTQLETAIINLVINAIQAMNPNGHLTVESAPLKAGVQVSITDTGKGIPPAIRDRIFEPFVTSKAEGDGTGLGLSTTLMVIEHHKGEIDFDTQEDKGTIFRIWLPAASPES
jgi:signal transduction histidine kinase/pSer/pThr/pTyr-binding forkhead associated (FHA) protein